MGWVRRDDEDDQLHTSSPNNSEFGSSNPRSGERYSTRKVVKSQCRTEEVESGKFVRKCEKTQEILRECIGKPVEVVQSTREYTEDDVTDEIIKGEPFTFVSSNDGEFDFPGLRSDLEAMEGNLIGGLSRFFEAAEEMKNGFLDVFAKASHIFDGEPSSSTFMRRGIPIDPGREASPEPNEHEKIDAYLSALAKDV